MSEFLDSKVIDLLAEKIGERIAKAMEMYVESIPAKHGRAWKQAQKQVGDPMPAKLANSMFYLSMMAKLYGGYDNRACQNFSQVCQLMLEELSQPSADMWQTGFFDALDVISGKKNPDRIGVLDSDSITEDIKKVLKGVEKEDEE